MSNKINDTQVGFVQGTTVLMADGRVKPIEKIVPGDWVMSFDQTDAASKLEPMEVIDTISYLSRDVIEVRSGEDAVMVARGQLFLTPTADWHRATETALITDRQGAIRSFTVQKVTEGKHKMYDIMVDQHHSLVANGFRVHNVLGGATTAGTAANAAMNSAAQSNKPPKDTKPGPAKNPNTNENRNLPGDRRGGGGGDGPDRGNGQNQENRKSSRNSKSQSKNKPKSPPPPTKEAQAYAALQSLEEIMGYICDVMLGYATRNYFTVKTAVKDYMNYAGQLANDAVVLTLASNQVSLADKNNISIYNADIIQTFNIILNAWDYPTETSVNLESVKRACLNVQMFSDRSQAVLAKYVGTGKSTIEYVVPGMPKPAPVALPAKPDPTVYVQTAPNSYAPAGNTIPPVTGGLGADYYRYRVVRGYLYGYKKGVGWVKIGPADQWEGQY